MLRAVGTQFVQQLQPLRRQLHVQVCVTPVTLPPGRLRLATSPSSTGSAAVSKTIGMVVVAAFAASAAGVGRPRQSQSPDAERDRPPAPAVDRFGPPPSDIRSPRSGHRRSRPRSALGRKAVRWPRVIWAEAARLRNPITGSAGCCARAASGQAAAAPPNSAMNSRRLIRSPRRRGRAA